MSIQVIHCIHLGKLDVGACNPADLLDACSHAKVSKICTLKQNAQTTKNGVHMQNYCI